MKMLKLERQKCSEPRFDELYRMIADLKDFLNEDANPNDKDWIENMKTIFDFQSDDGSFNLFDAYDIPSDARVDFCWMPTYICTAILMKAYMTDSQTFTPNQKAGFSKGLEMSCSRNLRGHGFDAFKSQIEALNIFMKAGLREFIDLCPEICPQFSEMICKIIAKFADMESQGDFLGPWGESYESQIMAVNEYFSQRNVFVYGTLMEGEDNHHYLQNATFLGRAFIEGYDMYDCGWYPAIVPGDGMIVGELYGVPKEDIPSIDALEGEGSLYIKRCETAIDAQANATLAFVYVYGSDCSDLERIPSWRQYVWYVSYGSNMLRERFMHYIEGGSYEGSRYRQACSDTTPPLAVKPVEIPFDMYFGNNSGSWENQGVSFIDTSRKGRALGVAYLITKEQFDHVAAQENGGRYPGGGEWYEDFIDLGTIGGIEARTITNEILRPYNVPCQGYWDILVNGIRQNWPEMSDKDIEDYLDGCIRES